MVGSALAMGVTLNVERQEVPRGSPHPLPPQLFVLGAVELLDNIKEKNLYGYRRPAGQSLEGCSEWCETLEEGVVFLGREGKNEERAEGSSWQRIFEQGLEG